MAIADPFIRMRSLLGFACFLLLFSSALEGSTIVRLKKDETPQGENQSLRTAKKGWHYLPALDLYIVDSAETIEKGVDFTEEDQLIQVANQPNDPLWENEWAFSPQSDYFGIQSAWEITTGDPHLTVAILDTGVDLYHNDLRDNLWTNPKEIPGNGKDDDEDGYVDDCFGYDFANDDPEPLDDSGHGTHLAGIIGAVGGNGIGVTGINWHIRILPLKIADARGIGTTSSAIKAIDYALQHGARIINASWVIQPREAGEKVEAKSLEAALAKAEEAGVLFVTAAGNGEEGGAGKNIQEDPVYPASLDLPNILAVAAATADGELASFSNYGSPTVDLVAPGVGILSTLPGNQYNLMSGTSMAAAYVTGAVALILSLHPDWDISRVSSALAESAPPSDLLKGVATSQGIPNIGQAIRSVGNDPEGQTTPPPSGGGGCSLLAGY